MEFDSLDEGDISWLTQKPSQDHVSHVSKNGNNSDTDTDAEIYVVGLVPSLEPNENVRFCHDEHQYDYGNRPSISGFQHNPRILYGEVVIEDISSDEEIDNM